MFHYVLEQTRRMKMTPYAWGLVFIFFIYFLIEWIYIHYNAMTMDDLWLTYHNLEYLHHLPYRDFSPYKTVLGYYLLLPPLMIYPDTTGIASFIHIKLWLVCLNTLGLIALSLWMQKFYTTRAICLTMGLMIFSHVFIFSSSEVRVDFLSFICATASVFLIYENRFFKSGLCIGLGFCICQKIIWFLLATQCAFTMLGFIQERNWVYFKKVLYFHIGFCMLLFAYICFWTSISNLRTVLQSIFIEPYLLNTTHYNLNFFQLRVVNFSNHFYWIMFIAFSIYYLWRYAKPTPIFEITYTIVICFFILTAKMPFNYLYMAFIPMLCILIPKTIMAMDEHQYLKFLNKDFGIMIAILLLFQALCFHFFITPTWVIVDGHFQAYMMQMANELLEPSDQYLAGNFLLPQKKQGVSGIRHLDSSVILYLHTQYPDLYPVMELKSLYYAPTSTSKIVADIQKNPVKLYIDNPQFHHMIKILQPFLHQQYQHFWGSIFLYAPVVNAGKQDVEIKFTGLYRIQSSTPIQLNGHGYAANTYIHLHKTHYQSNASSSYRLVLVPQSLKTPLISKWKNNQWRLVIK
ncbi:MAG: hypothetical protein EBQ95_06865 [Gammaproteobacteria bacterium]|nr:hypothetical protein [Gammaproteobacteria bacterium]